MGEENKWIRITSDTKVELTPDWSEEEYELVSAIWWIFRMNPGTNGKKAVISEIRKFIENENTSGS
jgi:hypothetical protein